jgi:hypothetical protein
LAKGFIGKAEGTLGEIRVKGSSIKTEAALLEIEGFRKHGQRQMDQITRRVVLGETIPHVESGINALENHGLDRCPDHGINGFKR